MNTFGPIHLSIQKEVDAKFADRQIVRHHEHQQFATFSKRPGNSLENINENEYNPHALGTLTAKCRIADPVERANRFK